MKVIESSSTAQTARKPDTLAGIRKRLSTAAVDKDLPAQDAIISALQKVLDNRYVMLRNITLEGPDVPIPLILVGPPGVRILYASAAKGVFRAREDTWEELDDRTQRFRVGRPNLLTRAALMGRAVDAYLATRGLQPGSSEAALCFSDPGIHVDMSRPAVRVVLADALERYAAGLVQSRSFLDQDQVQRVVNALLGEKTAAATVQKDPNTDARDAFSFLDLAPDSPDRLEPEIIMDRSEPAVFQRIPFTRRQLILLGLMILVNIIILVGFVALVLVTSRSF